MKLEASKGSVLDDIADSPEQAEELKAKAALMNTLISHIHSLSISNASAAKRFEVPEEHIEHLLLGRISKLDLCSLQSMVALVDDSKAPRGEP